MEQENKNTNNCHIYLVVGKLDKKGFSHRIELIDCDETKKMYVTPTKRISKDKIMKIDTHIIENHRFIHYFTYCLEGQQQEALNMLKAHIVKKTTQIKQEVDELFKWL